MIEHECPHCGHELRTKDALAGRKVACSKCDVDVLVPMDTEIVSVPKSHKKPGKNAFLDELPEDLPDEVAELGEPLALHKADDSWTQPGPAKVGQRRFIEEPLERGAFRFA